MEKSIYEVDEQHKQLAAVGRSMCDMSENANCKGMKEQDFKLLNDMSHVGSLLTKIGNAFGPKLEKDFTAEDMNLIARFVKKEIDIPQMRVYTVYNNQGKGAKMLELIGFVAIAYIIYKLAPIVLEVGFKFAIICLGLLAFLIVVSIFMSTWTVWVS